MKKSKNYMRRAYFNDFYCTKCGHKGIPLLRGGGDAREPGHLKKLFCLYCNEQVNMAEIRQDSNKYTLEMFEKEFKNGNFEDGIRKQPFKTFLAELETKEKKEGEENDEKEKES